MYTLNWTIRSSRKDDPPIVPSLLARTWKAIYSRCCDYLNTKNSSIASSLSLRGYTSLYNIQYTFSKLKTRRMVFYRYVGHEYESKLPGDVSYARCENPAWLGNDSAIWGRGEGGGRARPCASSTDARTLSHRDREKGTFVWASGLFTIRALHGDRILDEPAGWYSRANSTTVSLNNAVAIEIGRR